jgi:hypothetical protein
MSRLLLTHMRVDLLYLSAQQSRFRIFTMTITEPPTETTRLQKKNEGDSKMPINSIYQFKFMFRFKLLETYRSSCIVPVA